MSHSEETPVERPGLSTGEAAFCEYLRLQEAGVAPSFAEFAAGHPGLEPAAVRCSIWPVDGVGRTEALRSCPLMGGQAGP